MRGKYELRVVTRSARALIKCRVSTKRHTTVVVWLYLSSKDVALVLEAVNLYYKNYVHCFYGVERRRGPVISPSISVSS